VEKYIKKILEATVYDVAIESPLTPATGLSARLNNQVFLKREDLQSVFSFKLRGAYNSIRQLDKTQAANGVITASAGNHAQGVALAASRLGIKATIVMGKNTPMIKQRAVRKLGAKVVLKGDNYDEAAAHARELMARGQMVYIHPFDDPDVIAGQGTIGIELLHQCPEVDVIFVPVGGGGLIAGIATYVKYLKPDTRIIGVEAEGSACLWAALQAGKRVSLPRESIDQFADGTAVQQVGKETFKLARRYVDEVIRVSTDEICAAIKDIFEDTRVISEPSGALAIAGLKKYTETNPVQDQRLIAIVSGANMNFDRLRHVSERTEVGEKREVLLAVEIPEQVGSFKAFCKVIGDRSITEFNYRFHADNAAQVLVGIQTSGDESDRINLVDEISRNYNLIDLSDNELAVVHVRHMVGGRAAALPDEHLFRFEFPERPGALGRFLAVLGNRFNISMFHYRNHGAAFGRVLAGIQIPAGEEKLFRDYLKKIGYRFVEETDNPAYRLFLC